ncbi:MAG: hypothetical protein WAT39_14050 [Planctomycetota bacterium]
MADDPQHAQQTPGQWAVRWHALVLGAVLVVSVPLLHLIWHWLLGHDEPLLRTRSQLPPPAATIADVLDGSWMLAKDRQLREDTPVTWWLRSTWNELRYRAGVPESNQVHFGKDEWFFAKEEVYPDRAAFDGAQDSRRRFLGEVRDLVRAAGAELFVVIDPDKTRIYPDYCYPDGALPACKRDNYAAILADLRALDIPTADLATAIGNERAANPEQGHPDRELYYRRDTHWRPAGALAAGRAVAAAIEGRCGDRLGPRVEMRLSGKTAVRVLCDLPANMAIGTVELADGAGGWRTAPMSLLAEHLSEVKEYYGVELRRGDTFVAMDGKDPAAEILLIGASFAEENGANAIALWLGRPLRVNIHYGATGLASLREVLPELRAGTKAKVVVWEIVERGIFDPAWRDQRL